LKKLGFEVGTTDGDFGPRTEKELIQFQLTNQKLTANGFFDKATRAYMETILSGLISVKSLADKVF
jgi:peptidoglycan hydrolase-like protein with peptidoglycan-binding domain